MTTPQLIILFTLLSIAVICLWIIAIRVGDKEKVQELKRRNENLEDSLHSESRIRNHFNDLPKFDSRLHILSQELQMIRSRLENLERTSREIYTMLDKVLNPNEEDKK